MGLLDKFVAKQMAKLPDFRAEVAPLLPPGETVLGLAFGMNLASTGSLAEITTVDLKSASGRLTNAAINAAAGALSTARHLGGAADSTARTAVPDYSDRIALILSETLLSFWYFGLRNDELPPRSLGAIPRAAITSIVQTGKESRGTTTTRITFRDESYVDYGVFQHDTDDFWAAC